MYCVAQFARMQASTYQVAILLQFNTADAYSVQQLQQLTDIRIVRQSLFE